MGAGKVAGASRIDAGKPDPGPLTWARPAWFPHWEAEHRAAREGVILMDMSFMAKFLVQGRDAGRVLNYISANHVDGPCGVISTGSWTDAPVLSA